jgi:hypothetical protein
MVDGKNLRYTKIALNNRDVRKILTDESTGDGNPLTIRPIQCHSIPRLLTITCRRTSRLPVCVSQTK